MSTTTTQPPQNDAADVDDNVLEFRPRANQNGSSTVVPGAAAVTADIAAGLPLEQTLEALLFVSPTPLTVGSLAEATEQDEEVVEACLLDMLQRWSDATSGIVLERVAGGWAFRASDHARNAL